MWSAALVAGALLVAQDLDSEPEGTTAFLRVDHVVAEVGDEVLTASELRAETELARLESGGLAAVRAGPPSRALTRAVLRNMIAREVLLAEARRLLQRPIPDERILEAVDRVRSRFESRLDFERFLERASLSLSLDEDQPPPGLVAIARANLTVERFVRLRLGPDPEVPEAEVLACLAARRAALAELDPASARALVTRALAAERRRRALLELLRQLAKRVEIRTTPEFAEVSILDDPGPEPGSFTCP